MSSLVPMGLAMPASAEQRVIEYTLTLRDYRFEPDTLTAVAGVPVVLTLVNPERLTPHNFTLKQGGGEVISMDVEAQETETVRFTPTAPGTYVFHCDTKLLWFKSHRERGMEGTLVVQAGP
jgi:plastocyanin